MLRFSCFAAIIFFACIAARSGEAASHCYKDLVCDSASLLSADQIKALSIYHEALLKRYDMDYRVVIVPDAGDLSQKSISVFKAANIGFRSKTRKGLLLMIDTTHDKVRLEVSAGLDAVYTDGFIAYLQQRQMIPFFQANRVADGVLATTELIVERAQKAAKGEEFIAPSQLPDNLAIGAGAQTAASIGTGYQTPPPAPAPQTANQSTNASALSPEQVVAAYHQALAQKNASPELDIYSQSTRELKRKWVVTPAQMANELAMYKGCNIDKIVGLAGKFAVVRYKVDQRKCAPYFLVAENGAWRLDFVTMMESIRFNIDNEWHFNLKKPLPYAAAFKDWRFDKNGFPFRQE